LICYNILMLEISGLQKKFGKREALKDVTFSLAPGEIYGLLGPNGAGKTTTLKILAGLLAADGGRIVINGEPYHREHHELKKLIAYVPDQPFLYYKLTGEEHMNFFQDLYKIPYAKRREKIDFFFKYFEFEEYRTELVENYSAGTRQKLLIAQALAVEPGGEKIQKIPQGDRRQGNGRPVRHPYPDPGPGGLPAHRHHH
jgi:ABC-2 type transport system ATP-binding protein